MLARIVRNEVLARRNTKTDVLWQNSTSTVFVQGMFDLNWPPLNLKKSRDKNTITIDI